MSKIYNSNFKTKASKKFNFREFQKLVEGKSLNKIIKLVCGEKIGEGVHREVFVCKQNPNFVVKVEKRDCRGIFANVTEWRNWMNNKEWKWFGKYLAPIELINETGDILVQRRVEFKEKKFYPKKIPILFTDIKQANFGWIDGQFVCCDYAYLLMLTVKTDSSRYKNANWKRKN